VGIPNFLAASACGKLRYSVISTKRSCDSSIETKVILFLEMGATAPAEVLPLAEAVVGTIALLVITDAALVTLDLRGEVDLVALEEDEELELEPLDFVDFLGGECGERL